MDFRPAPVIAVVAVLCSAAFLRFLDLPDIRQGFYQDEAISGIQALDFMSGTDREIPFVPKMLFPLWTMLEAPFVALFGMTPLAVRLPAAILGMATVALAFFAGRSVGGVFGALGAAGFLAFSLWHVIYSRIGASPVLVPLEGLALGLILLGPVPRRPFLAGIAAGLASGCGLLSYYAGWSLPLVLAAGIIIRYRLESEFRPVVRRLVPGALVGLVACACVLAVYPGSVGISGSLVRLAPWEILKGFGSYLLALFVNPWPPDITPGFWGVYPPGTPLLSPVESAVVIGGVVALFLGSRPRWQAAMVIAWVVLGILPAAMNPGGLRYSRAIGMLAPLAFLVAAGFARLRMVFPRPAPWILSAILLFSAAWGWHGYFSVYCRDLRVAVWSNIVDVELAQYLVQRAKSSRIILRNTRDESAVLEFIACREIRSGRIEFRPGPAGTGVFQAVLRDPLWHQPMIFVFQVPERAQKGETVLLVMNPDGFLSGATKAESAGRWGDAARAYQEALEMFPDLGIARWRLAGVLERLGDKGGAERERAEAFRLGVGEAGPRINISDF